MHRLRLLVLLGVALLLAACHPADPALVHGGGPEAGVQVTQGSDGAAASLIGHTYHLGVDDVVRVSVWGNPDLSVTVPVRPDGMISVPLVGDVRAGGLAPMQVARNIEKALSTYVRKPQVAVIVTNLKSHEFLTRVRVTGAVLHPVTLPFRQGMTVLDAVLEAGGVNQFASANGTVLHRRIKGQTEVLHVDLGDILNKGNLKTNYALRPGDVVTVPERLF